VGQRGAELTLEAHVAGVGAIAGGGSADTERGAGEHDDEPDDAGSLAAFEDWRPASGPLHARPPASWFEVGDHAKRDFSLQSVFRQMSERT
jgi:hypothetical protein